MSKIQCSGFIVHYDGDETVGMFSQEWTIFGEFMFDSPDDFEAFKCKICEAFELCSDTPVWAESIEERSTKINAEIAHFSAHHFV